MQCWKVVCWEVVWMTLSKYLIETAPTSYNVMPRSCGENFNAQRYSWTDRHQCDCPHAFRVLTLAFSFPSANWFRSSQGFCIKTFFQSRGVPRVWYLFGTTIMRDSSEVNWIFLVDCTEKLLLFLFRLHNMSHKMWRYSWNSLNSFSWTGSDNE